LTKIVKKRGKLGKKISQKEVVLVENRNKKEPV
jgi:hypothetical protein